MASSEKKHLGIVIVGHVDAGVNKKIFKTQLATKIYKMYKN